MLHAAPFFGEFGWEVAMWVPWLRYHANLYSGQEMFVVCRRGRAPLYRDFATSIIEVDDPGAVRPDCSWAWIDGVRLQKKQYVELVKKAFWKDKAKQVLTPLDMPFRAGKHGCPTPTKEHRPHRYMPGSKRGDLLLFHVRACGDKQPERNWNIIHGSRVAMELMGAGVEMASVGHPDMATHVPGTEDRREVAVDGMMDLMARALLVIGPSSGPLHLANYCGTPVVWWSPNLKETVRYDSVWNPFKCPNVRAAKSWSPTPDEVITACRTSLSSR